MFMGYFLKDIFCNIMLLTRSTFPSKSVLQNELTNHGNFHWEWHPILKEGQRPFETFWKYFCFWKRWTDRPTKQWYYYGGYKGCICIKKVPPDPHLFPMFPMLMSKTKSGMLAGLGLRSVEEKIKHKMFWAHCDTNTRCDLLCKKNKLDLLIVKPFLIY